jgi:hypothetical protein
MALIKVCDVCGVEEKKGKGQLWHMISETMAVRLHIDICEKCIKSICIQSQVKRAANKGDKSNGKKV